jgi:hypothetical protein
VIAEIWRQLLGRAQVSRQDSFFEVGGNSLLVVQVRARLLAATGLEVSLVDLFRHPTIAGLAAALAGRPTGPSTAEAATGTATKRRAALAHAGGIRRGRRNG